MTSDDTADDQPATAAAGNDETTVLPPPTEAAAALAYSEADDGDLGSWRDAIGSAALPLFVTAAVAVVALAGFWVWLEWPSTLAADNRTSSAVAQANPSPALPNSANSDQYVAVALSPHTHKGGAGTAGTQERADQIALNECKSHGDDLCMVAAREHLGCAEYAYGDGGDWAGASGPDPQTAHANVTKKLRGTYVGGGFWCSTPPGNPTTASTVPQAAITPAPVTLPPITTVAPEPATRIAAPAQAPLPDPTLNHDDRAFLVRIHQDKLPTDDDGDAVLMGHQQCSEMRQDGTSTYERAEGLQGALHWTFSQAFDFVTDAAIVYCPQLG